MGNIPPRRGVTYYPVLPCQGLSEHPPRRGHSRCFACAWMPFGTSPRVGGSQVHHSAHGAAFRNIPPRRGVTGVPTHSNRPTREHPPT